MSLYSEIAFHFIFPVDWNLIFGFFANDTVNLNQCNLTNFKQF